MLRRLEGTVEIVGVLEAAKSHCRLVLPRHAGSTLSAAGAREEESKRLMRLLSSHRS